VRDIDLNRLAGHLGRDWCLINRRWPIKRALHRAICLTSLLTGSI